MQLIYYISVMAKQNLQCHMILQKLFLVFKKCFLLYSMLKTIILHNIIVAEKVVFLFMVL